MYILSDGKKVPTNGLFEFYTKAATVEETGTYNLISSVAFVVFVLVLITGFFWLLSELYSRWTEPSKKA